MRRTVFMIGMVLVLVGMASPAAAQFPEGALPLWADGAPGAVGSDDGDRPSITPYLPEGGELRSAVVVFPGGGYGHLAVDHEGEQVARWLNSRGVAAFVVRYRLGPTYQHPAMLQDAQRAVRLVRSRASEWRVDPASVGVIGFSAGGHLASMVGTQFADELPGAGDLVDGLSARPDFLMLIYPVITMQNDFTHRGSRGNLLGENSEAEMVWRMSSESRVTPETPPTFLVHTTDDAGVPVENSLIMYQALRRAGVPVEMHIFETGRHGFGLGGEDPVLTTWPGLAEGWMRSHGWMR